MAQKNPTNELDPMDLSLPNLLRLYRAGYHYVARSSEGSEPVAFKKLGHAVHFAKEHRNPTARVWSMKEEIVFHVTGLVPPSMDWRIYLDEMDGLTLQDLLDLATIIRRYLRTIRRYLREK